MKKIWLLFAVSALAGGLFAAENHWNDWNKWAKPKGTTINGAEASAPLTAGKRVSFSTKAFLEAGEWYTISFECRFAGADKKDIFRIVFGNEKEFQFSEQTFNCQTEWTRSQVSIYAEKAGTPFVGLTMKPAKAQTFELRNPVIHKLSPEERAKTVFVEDGNMAGCWKLYGSINPEFATLTTVEAEDHIDGGRAVKLALTPNAPQTMKDCFLNSPAFPFEPGKKYKISVWFKSDMPGTAYVGAAWPREKGTKKRYYVNMNVPCSVDWKKCEAEFTAPSLEDQPMLNRRVARGNIGFNPGAMKTLYFKDWTLEQLP